jgi:ribose/xylose/arabinose/galactoside ABC-type transport system permease subunit
VALNRTERTLAFIIAGIIGLSILSIAAIFIAGAAGVATNSGIWLAVLVLPLIGLPLGMVLGIVLLVLLTVRRRRLAPDAGR